MNIEQEIFKKFKVDFSLVLGYGFTKANELYSFSKNIYDDKFRADIIISNEGIVSGKVIDIKTDEEYVNIRTNLTGSFVNKVRDEYKNLLYDIRDKCFSESIFVMPQSNRIAKMIFEKYQAKPEFLWEKYPSYGVFRNKISNKWFALIMLIHKSKLGEVLDNEVEVINLKLGKQLISEYLNKEGFYKAYHMNSKTWITIILDNKVSDAEIMNLIEISYGNTNK